MAIFNMTLDTDKSRVEVPKEIKVRQGETNSNIIVATILQQGQAYDFSRKKVRFECLKPDGRYIRDANVEISGNSVTYVMNYEISTAPGSIQLAYFAIYEEGETGDKYLETTGNFYIYADESAEFKFGGMASDSYINEFQGMREQFKEDSKVILERLDAFKRAADSLQESAGSAVLDEAERNRKVEEAIRKVQKALDSMDSSAVRALVVKAENAATEAKKASEEAVNRTQGAGRTATDYIKGTSQNFTLGDTGDTGTKSPYKLNVTHTDMKVVKGKTDVAIFNDEGVTLGKYDGKSKLQLRGNASFTGSVEFSNAVSIAGAPRFGRAPYIDGVQTDYILAQGDSGGWHYRKWSSGWCEATKVVRLPNNSRAQDWGSGQFIDCGIHTYPFRINDNIHATATYSIPTHLGSASFDFVYADRCHVFAWVPSKFARDKRDSWVTIRVEGKWK